MNRVSEQIIKLQSTFTGNITPISWYKNIRKDGKRHLVDGTAIAILADIMYWYRPVEVRDESTGRLKGYKQKFAADKLQKSYQSYAELLGVPKSEVKRAIDNLVRLNLITREFRNIKTKEGLSINNVMFLEPILENIIKISYTSNEEYGAEVLGDTPQKLSRTNTKTTTKITTENTTKDIKNTHKNEKSITKDEKQIKAKELIEKFCSLRNIPLDTGFFKKNIRAARSLVSNYSVELILAGITWRLKNDPDGFWQEKLWSLNSVYSHFAEWIAQAKLKKKTITFTEWLDEHPEQDYRKIPDDKPEAMVAAFFAAYKQARKEGVILTPEEWDKYQAAREYNNKLIKGGKYG